MKTVKGLSDTQLNFKPNAETWSEAECIEHLAISEKANMGIVDMAKQSTTDPSERSSLPFSDQQEINFTADRSTKVKTQPNLEPKNSLVQWKDLWLPSKNSVKPI